ncbi:MAG: MATE family efflux transporter [Clostridia bacterium]|nr:MATE family efflux transporter [Clostridia bacterium]
MTKNRYLFEEMPVPKALATLAIPTIISQLITMIYNLADTYFIGTTNDPYKVAASSVAFVLVFAMNCLSNLFGVGGGSLISRLLGQHREKEASSVASFSFYGSLIVSAIYSVLLYIFMEPFLRLLGATDNTIGYATDYALWIVVFGAIPSTLGLTMSHMLRSEGYAKHSSFGLALGGVLNMVLDPLFMFVILEPGNEVKGAAIATMLSNVAVLVYFLCVYFAIRKKTVISLSPFKMIPKREHVISVFAVGFPSALGSFLACLSSIMVNKLASGHGDIEVAAIGIAKKIDMLPMNVGMGLCQGMMPLVAYNYSSGNYKRMKQFSDAARTAGIVFALICIIVFEIFAPELVRFFIDEAATVALGTRLLRAMCLAVPLMIVNFQMSFTFQAMGMGKQSLLLSSLRQGLVNIPLLFLMNHLFAIDGIAWTQLISDAITTAISFAVYFATYKKLMSKTDKLDDN